MATTLASRNAVRHWGAGTAAIARTLIAANEPLTGVAVAKQVGVSQPRVSQVLKLFAEHHAVRATDDGYVGRPSKLLDLYVQRARPSLLEPESYWYSTRPMADQANRLVQLARHSQVRVAFSADVAPDLLVPWRHPTLTVAYADAVPRDLTAEFVPAEDRADASLILRRTSDTTLFQPALPWPTLVDDIPLTDPTQQWADLLALGGEDRREAAERLRRAILEHTLPGER
jgi:hypothetical protein